MLYGERAGLYDRIYSFKDYRAGAERVRDFLWAPPGSGGFVERVFRRLSQFIYAIGRDLAGGQLTLRATGLVYTTLLSLVPLLAFSFSVLKGFGVHRQIEPLLYNFLEPLGERGEEITRQVRFAVRELEDGAAAIDAAVGVGLHPDFETAIAEMTRVRDAFDPDPQNREIYDGLYREVYLKMYRRLQPLYKKIRSITGYPP